MSDSRSTMAYCLTHRDYHHFGFGPCGEMAEGLHCRKGEPPDSFPPSVRCNETTQILMDLFMTKVGAAIDAALEKRDIKPGAFGALHCQSETPDPNRMTITFTLAMRGPDDTEITFRGAR